MAGYTRSGCRCETCRAAWAAYHRDYRRRRTANEVKPLRDSGASAAPAATDNVEGLAFPVTRPRFWVDHLVRAGIYLLTGALAVLVLIVSLPFTSLAALAGAAVLIGGVVIVGNAALGRIGLRCHLCGTRDRHRCNLTPDVQNYSRFQRGILRDPARRAGEPWRGTMSRAAKQQPDIVWECSHRHRYAFIGDPRGLGPAKRCAFLELAQLQRGRAGWSYPFRPRPVRRFRYQPGVRLSLPQTERERLVGETNGRCFYCGQETEQLEADHVIPVSRGGSSMTWNFVPACRECNRLKGVRTGWEFVPHPTSEQRQRFLEIDGLTQRRPIAWLERRRLEREASARRREGTRKGARKRSEVAQRKWERRQWWYREEEHR